MLTTMTDNELLRRFEDLTLPFEQWMHRAHVKVAYLYLRAQGFAEALKCLRRGIQAYNVKNNVPDNATSGYNETTTHAFLHLIAATIRAYGETHPTNDADSFCEMHPQLKTGHALRLFYSPQGRMHPDAKLRFI